MKTILGENIRIQNNRLRLTDSDARGRLEGLIQAMTAESNSSEIEPIVLKCDDELPVILRLMAISEPAQSLFRGASAILTFVRVRPRPRPAPALLSQIFGLTPAEARLTAAIAGGSTLIEAAKALSISWETARTQLKTVFLKTDTHRQSELVALLSRV
jgi:DNA-binding CsgD family transcriptional regulator